MRRTWILFALLLFPLAAPAADESYSDRPEGKQFYIPHLALSACDKGRWKYVWNKCWETDIILRNKSVHPMDVRVLLHGSDGQRLTVLFQSPGDAAKEFNSEQGPLLISVPPLGVAVSTFTLPLIERSLIKNLSDWPSETKSGWLSFEPSSPEAMEAFALFRFKKNGNIVNQAYEPFSIPATRFTSYLRRVTAGNGIPVDMGLAIANPNHAAAKVTFAVRGRDGKEIKLRRPFPTLIPAMGQIAGMLNALVYIEQPDLIGTLEINSDIPIVVTALQMTGKNIGVPGEAIISTMPATTP